MSIKQYQLKKFDSGNYIPFLNQGVIFKSSPLEIFGDDLFFDIKTFPLSYPEIIVPEEVSTILDDLLDTFSLKKFKPEFLTLICATQNSYIFYKRNLDGTELDFQNEKIDFRKLLNVLGKYLLAEDRSILQSISFKYNTINFKDEPQDNIPIKNFFVIDEIYSALCNAYGLTKENFITRSEKLLLKVNDFDFETASENIKYCISKMLFNFVNNGKINQSNALRFVNSFLYLSQIKANNNNPSNYIEFSAYVYYKIENDDIKNMRQFLLREKDFTLK